MTLRLLWILCLAWCCSFHLAAQPEPGPDLAPLFIGTFTNRAQVDQDASYALVHLEVVQIWKHLEGTWLLIDQQSDPSHPWYNQCYVYHIEREGHWSYLLQAYTLPEGSDWSIALSRPRKAKKWTPDQLIPSPNCRLGLSYNNSYSGATEDRCEDPFYGAALFTRDIRISSKDIRLIDQGWTEEGELIWGRHQPLILIRE
jgi:hypothetical protein